jgi:ABC-type lipoprotein export system ATPase subunit
LSGTPNCAPRFLDDPVQSLDHVNLLSLADMLRTVRNRRQIIVSTHDEVLAELLIRTLRPLGAENATAVVDDQPMGRDRAAGYLRDAQR